MPVQKFSLTIDWNIEFNPDIKNKIAGYNHILNLLNLKNDPKNCWYKTFANIYNVESNNYDGYIQDVYHNELNKKIYIDFYLVEDNLKKFKEEYPNNWKEQEHKNIKESITKNIESFYYLENDQIQSYMIINNIELKEIN